LYYRLVIIKTRSFQIKKIYKNPLRKIS
jgi:hypothetical protein